jgi:hypothetical protein
MVPRFVKTRRAPKTWQIAGLVAAAPHVTQRQVEPSGFPKTMLGFRKA